MELVFLLFQSVYWLGLSTWFGGVLFVALAAPVVFRVVTDARPMLPEVLSVNLDNQHATLLAGSVMANLLAMVFRVQIICMIGVGVGMLAQWFTAGITSGADIAMAILRNTLFVAAVIAAIYLQRSLWPKIMTARQKYIDNADSPDIANPARDDFERLQNDSVTVLRNLLFLLMGIILFSTTIRFISVSTFN